MPGDPNYLQHERDEMAEKPDKRCAACKWWKPTGWPIKHDKYGIVREDRSQPATWGECNHEDNVVQDCPPDFGCIHWESKQGES